MNKIYISYAEEEIVVILFLVFTINYDVETWPAAVFAGDTREIRVTNWYINECD